MIREDNFLLYFSEMNDPRIERTKRYLRKNRTTVRI